MFYQYQNGRPTFLFFRSIEAHQALLISCNEKMLQNEPSQCCNMPQRFDLAIDSREESEGLFLPISFVTSHFWMQRMISTWAYFHCTSRPHRWDRAVVEQSLLQTWHWASWHLLFVQGKPKHTRKTKAYSLITTYHTTSLRLVLHAAVAVDTMPKTTAQKKISSCT